MEAAAADGATNSKVIVQLTDPNGLFGDVAPLLQNRLPLGNLHWKSPTRPLRSIEALDVSLDREQVQPQNGGAGIRRHQIPGLRQTPFVKILLLRCDDKEKYKESVRKEVKEWVKSLGFSTSGKATTKGQERHDAYEYIIVHVVVPGTTAANQPKSVKHVSVEMADSTDSVNSKSKWTGKSTSTILDKLKADFSNSSKAPFERVAQIRLTDPTKPSTTLSPLEMEEQWQDLIEKLKTAILQSFDARVAQYEEDIREREQQRSLPGWNFCTFFILKEGLARGFENVGLLEDAIQIYEELDAGLDAVIQDQANEDYSDAANALLPYASDLKDTIRAALDRKDEHDLDDDTSIPLSLQAWSNVESKRFPWRLERRNYQQMILTNQVSALDFRIYIFIRQMQFMLRRAAMSTPLPRSKSSNRQSGPRWDANMLSEICERSIKFMNLAARNLRQDLFAAWGGQKGLPDEELKVQQVVIDNIVASWKWSSLLQTLSECQIITSLSRVSAGTDGELESGNIFSPKDIASSHAHTCSTSTASSNSAATAVNGTNASTVKDMFAALKIVKGSKTELVFWAAELFIMLRTILLQLCRSANLLPHLTKDSYTASDVDASDSWIGILAPSLRDPLRSEESAAGAYKLLTICACQCYTTAGKSRASRQLLFDLATFEVHNGNHEVAASWMDAIPGFLDSPPRTPVERSMLGLYIECLRRAGRREELIHCLFLDIQSTTTNDSGLNVQQIWSEMVELADNTGPIEFPFDAIFAVEDVCNHISHDGNHDFYTISVALRVLVPLVNPEKAMSHLECHSIGQHLPAKLTLEHEITKPVEHSRINLQLKSTVQTEGWYNATTLTITLGKITFKHDFARAQSHDADHELNSISLSGPPSIYVYPRDGAPQLHASHAPMVDLAQKRNMSIRLKWPSNDVNSAHLKFKPATAGVRLDVQSAQHIKGPPFEVRRIDESQVIVFNSEYIGANEESVVEISYSLDDASTISMSVRAEMKYESTAGPCEYYDILSFSTLLPISVNVQDVFQRHASFSRFTFSPSRLVPLQLLSCKLEGTVTCRVIETDSWTEPVDAFPKQPASWIVQTKIYSQPVVTSPSDKLVLIVDYKCMDEVILNTISNIFHNEATRPDFAKGGRIPINYALRSLMTHLRTKLQSLWSEQDIELAALTGEIQMWIYEEVDWDPLLSIFEKDHRESMRQWLREWHELCSRDPLPLVYDTTPTRTLRVLVDPPRTDMVVTTQIKLNPGHVCIVGQPILAQLRVSNDTRAELDAEVSIEVTSPSDSWLIGGQRKATFTSSQSMFLSTIVLIAQKTGNLLLPSIDVKCRGSKDAGVDGGRSIGCEVDNISAAVAVVVRNDIATTTVGVGDGHGEGGEGHWLVDARGP